mmetsp:Transcript_41112/g.69067  ORF Transcript_41112/g.69067 Transcript_41112/m.69067 type:complete len:84 (+) Transcript_41112:728-979(+)
MCRWHLIRDCPKRTAKNNEVIEVLVRQDGWDVSILFLFCGITNRALMQNFAAPFLVCPPDGSPGVSWSNLRLKRHSRQGAKKF